MLSRFMLNKKHAILLAAVLLAPGCSGGDPATARLAVGSAVLLITDDVDFDGKPMTGLLVETEDPIERMKQVEGGTRATVVRDDGKAEDPHRRVIVHVTEGAVMTGGVERRDCHPVK